MEETDEEEAHLSCEKLLKNYPENRSDFRRIDYELSLVLVVGRSRISLVVGYSNGAYQTQHCSRSKIYMRKLTATRHGADGCSG